MRLSASRITVTYVLFGALFAVSGEFATNVILVPGAPNWLHLAQELGKAAVFLGVTATLLYLLLRHVLHQRDTAYAQLAASTAALEQRAQQQEALATVRHLALAETDSDQLMDVATRLTATTLAVPRAALLKHDAEQGGFVLYIAVGIASTSQQAAVLHSLPSDASLLTTSRATPCSAACKTFAISAGMPCSGLQVVIRGGIGNPPHGVLVLCGDSERQYTPTEQQFVEAMVDVLGTALTQRRVRATLDAQQSMLAAVIEGAPSGIVVVGSDQSLLSVNQRFLDMWGLDRQRLQHEAVLPSIMRQQVLNPAASVRSLEHHNRHPDSRPSFEDLRLRDGRTLERRSVPARDGNGTVYGRIWFYHDVSERVWMTAALEQTNSQLQLLNRIISEASTATGTTALLTTLVHLLEDHADVPAGVLYLYDSRRECLHARQRWGLASLAVVPRHLALADAHNREAIVLQRMQHQPAPPDALLPRGVAQAAALGWGAYLAVPLLAQGHIVGVLDLWLAHGHTWTPRQMTFLATLGRQIGAAIQHNQLFDEVQQNHERLRDLSRQLLAVHEHERRQIARELHDEVGQMLTLLNLNLSRIVAQHANTSVPTSELEDASAIVQSLMQQVRSLALNLRPHILDMLGLLPALRWLTEHISLQSGIVVQLHPHNLDQRLPGDIETAAYRIVQEALTNVVRHARAREVVVRVWCDDSNVHISIEDDGVGFDPTDVLDTYASTGLPGMRERALWLGGSFELESFPAQGATIAVTLPLVATPETPLEVV